MKSPRLFILNIFLLLVFSNCSNESTDAGNAITNALDPSQSYRELNISYGNDTKQTFDLHLPANRTLNTKTMILVHGGGWTSGDKNSMDYLVDLIQFELPDIAIANINYRLANENTSPYPMQLDDITSIINYLKDNTQKYTISKNFGFIGTSAGGHLSLLWSYAFDTNSNINMVCSIVGPTDFTDPVYTESTDPVILSLISAFGENLSTEFLKEVSPLHQLTASAPPTILFHGGMDPLIPNSQGTLLRDKLADLGIDHQFVFYPNEGHGWTGTNLLDTWAKLKVFMIDNL